MTARSTYTVRVEPDNLKPNHFMVVIRDQHNDISSIPLRGVSEKTAKESLHPIRFAFKAGVEAGFAALRDTRVEIFDA